MKTWPIGAVDTHVHLFDTARFPFSRRAAYHPLPGECGTGGDLIHTLDAHGMAGALLVNPTSGYGTDNSCMLDALKRHPRPFRGVARVPLNTSPSRLNALAKAGVIGVRIDLLGDGLEQLAHRDFSRLVGRVADAALWLEVQAGGDQLAVALPQLTAARGKLLIGHCGRPDPAHGLRQPGFRALLSLADSGRAAVKLSGPMRFSHQSYPYRDTQPYVAALLRAFTPQQCVWASDWPFLRAPARLDYGLLQRLFDTWVPDARARRVILVDTPRRMFGFAP
ncbi:MAG: amidohydrolase family protein [Betaproteobacteria bacterium]